jgi:hypothetical protein
VIEIKKMAGPGSSSSHAILDLGEDELQFSTHDYKTKVIMQQEQVGPSLGYFFV